MPQTWTAPSLLPTPDPSSGVIRWDMAVNNVIQSVRDAQEFKIRKEELAIRREQAVLEFANARMKNEILKLDYELEKAKNSPEMLQKRLELETVKIDSAKAHLERETHTAKSLTLIEGITADLDLDIEAGDPAAYNAHINAFMKSPEYKNLTLQAQSLVKTKVEEDKKKVFTSKDDNVVTWGDARINAPASPLRRVTEFEENRFMARKRLEAEHPYASKEQLDALETAVQSKTALAVRAALTGTTIEVKEQEKRDILAGRIPGTAAAKTGIEATPGIVKGLSGSSWLDKALILTKIKGSTKIGPVMDAALAIAKTNITAVDVGNDPVELARKQLLLNRIDRIKPLIRDINNLPTWQSHVITTLLTGRKFARNVGALRELVAIPSRIRLAIADDTTVDKLTGLNDLLNAYTALPEDSEDRINLVDPINRTIIDVMTDLVCNEEMTTVQADLARLRTMQGEKSSAQPQKQLYRNKTTGETELR